MSLIYPFTHVVATRIARRFDGVPAWVVSIELFIGFGWLRAATERIITPDWWDGTALRGFLAAGDGAAVSWYQPFVEFVVQPGAPLVSIIVIGLQLFVGAALVFGVRICPALGVGMFMNLHFVAAGAVSPSVFYLLAQGAVGLWMVERSSCRRTLDRIRTAGLVTGVLVWVNVFGISTLDPHLVIDDPAMMFVFGGGIAAVALAVAYSRVLDRSERFERQRRSSQLAHSLATTSIERSHHSVG